MNNSMSCSCPFNVENRCTLVEDFLIYQPVPTTESICHNCQQTDKPQRLNFVTLNLAARTSERTGVPIPPADKNSYGTKLEGILAPFFQELPGCKCEGHKDILDQWSNGYIILNIDRVLDWLQEAARMRKLPFSRRFTKILLLSTID